MGERSRRQVLHGISAISLPVLAGCGDSSNTTPAGPTSSTDTVGTTKTDVVPDGAVNTPSLADCDPSDVPDPTQAAGDLKPKTYPEYPDNFEKSEIKKYAVSFEKSYRNNKFLTESPNEYDELTIHSGIEAISEHEQSYLMRIEGTVLFSDEKQPTESTATRYPSGRSPFVTWFYCDEDFVLRDGRDRGYTDSLEPNFENAEILVCP